MRKETNRELQELLKRLREMLLEGLIKRSSYAPNSEQDNAWNDGYRKGVLATIKVLEQMIKE